MKVQLLREIISHGLCKTGYTISAAKINLIAGRAGNETIAEEPQN